MSPCVAPRLSGRVVRDAAATRRPTAFAPPGDGSPPSRPSISAGCLSVVSFETSFPRSKRQAIAPRMARWLLHCKSYATTAFTGRVLRRWEFRARHDLRSPCQICLATSLEPCLDLSQVPQHTSRREIEATGQFLRFSISLMASSASGAMSQSSCRRIVRGRPV